MASNKRSVSASDVLEALFRHRVKATLIPATILGLGLAIALFAPRTYRSEAKLGLQVGRQSVNIDPTAQTGQQMISLQQMGREGEVTTAMDLIRSRGVIEKVVDRIGPDYILRGGPEGSGEQGVVGATIGTAVDATLGNLIRTIKSIDPISDREEAIIEVEENLGVDAERDSTLIDITYSTASPIGAQTVLSTLVDIYQEEHLRIHRNEGSRAFFQEQEASFRDQLNEAMDAVRAAKDEIGVASIDARRTNLEQQLQSITMAAYQADAERTAQLAELRDLRRQLSSMPERLISSTKQVPNVGADLLRDQLYALQVRQADLKARFSDTHPAVVAVSAQIEQAEKVVDEQQEVREETTDDVNPIHRALSLETKQTESLVASLDARLKMLADQDRSVRQDLEKLNADEVRLAQLERDQSILNRKYFRYSDNLEQARIDAELEAQKISSVSIAQSPTLAEKPVSPKKVFVGLGAMALALAATAATILGLEQASDKLRSEDAIEEATGVPVLATVPDTPVHGRVLAP